jgi:hypothetical protein
MLGQQHWQLLAPDKTEIKGLAALAFETAATSKTASSIVGRVLDMRSLCIAT